MPHVASERVDGRALGAFVRKQRRALELSQRELGEACGLSVSRIQAIEMGAIAHMLRPRQLAGLASALRVDDSRLLSLAGYRQHTRECEERHDRAT